MRTEILREDGLERAAGILKMGGLVAVPTETVYGLAANGLDPAAVERIYQVKERPPRKPINLLIPDMDAVETLCLDIPRAAYSLAERFWPGPLTMILKKTPRVPDIVTAGGATVGVRCPDHPLTLRLLRLCALPLATPSANPHARPSPKDLESVLRYFDGRIECAVDGGPCSVGMESTILDLSGEAWRILRQGGLPREDIEEALGRKVL